MCDCPRAAPPGSQTRVRTSNPGPTNPLSAAIRRDKVQSASLEDPRASRCKQPRRHDMPIKKSLAVLAVGALVCGGVLGLRGLAAAPQKTEPGGSSVAKAV